MPIVSFRIWRESRVPGYEVALVVAIYGGALAEGEDEALGEDLRRRGNMAKPYKMILFIRY